MDRGEKEISKAELTKRLDRQVEEAYQATVKAIKAYEDGQGEVGDDEDDGNG